MASLFPTGITLALVFIGRLAILVRIMGSIQASVCWAESLDGDGPRRLTWSDPMAETHYLLDAHEAAQILRMDRRTLVRWARLGQVPAHPMGEGKRKLWRFVEHELLQWVEARRISSERRPPASTIETAISAHARRTA